MLKRNKIGYVDIQCKCAIKKGFVEICHHLHEISGKGIITFSLNGYRMFENTYLKKMHQSPKIEA